MNKFIKLLLFSMLFICKSCYGQNKIFINELLIDPLPQQVELINTGEENIDISGWFIDDSGGTTYYTIPQSTVVYPNSCTVFSGDFNLNKTSADSIRLFNSLAPPTSSTAALIDNYSYKSSPGNGISFLRIPDGDIWSTGSANIGLYNQTKQPCIIFPTIIPLPTVTPTAITTSTAIPTPTNQTGEISPTVYYENIYISEVMVNALPGNNEWLEIFNNNDFSVDLNNWYIDDGENNGSTPKIFSLNIPGKSYRVINFTSSMFNNNGDSVRIIDFNKKQKDGFEYSYSVPGKTWGRNDLLNDDFCIQDPSYELINIPCESPTPIINISKLTNSITPSYRILLTPSISYGLYSTPPIIHSNNNVSYNPPIIPSGTVLGTSTTSTATPITFNQQRSLVKILSIVSLSYSLLTIAGILFKIKSIYAKTVAIFSPSVYTSSGE